MTVHILGIRHHGPGSARSLRAALDELIPDVVLIEGPPDANALIPLVASKQMQPPVALLLYAKDDTTQAVYYPFAVFSPEFQAMQWALEVGAEVRFMDLPQTHQFGLRQAQPMPDMPITPPAPDDIARQVQLDPLGWLGRAAGYADGERWWEHVIEQRRDNLRGVFEAVLEAMTALRETAGEVTDPTEAKREAYMRTTIREAQAQGYENIAVVCGAWHSPALVEHSPMYQSAEQDATTLADMPSAEVVATWIPWTYGRLARESGYGAGIASPGWYHHLWENQDNLVIRWLTKVAALLRQQDLDASTAQVIDTVRLIETLTAMRGLSLPSLDELNEAITATMTFGAEKPLELIHQQLIISSRLGHVPDETPMVPLQRDLEQQVAAIRSSKRTKPETDSFFDFHDEQTRLILDLRKPRDRKRSYLLHRLNILEVEWGRVRFQGNRSSTYREEWRLQWKPEFVIRLIEQSIWGNTIESAASRLVLDKIDHSDNLRTLTQYIDMVFHADLPQVTEKLVDKMRDMAALTTNIADMMEALTPLVGLKSGHHETLGVRQVTLDNVGGVIDTLLTRITVGLPNACASLDDAAADAMHNRLIEAHGAVIRLHNDKHTTAWHAALVKLTNGKTVHGLVAGRAARLLLDVNAIDTTEAERLMRLAISTASQPTDAAAWVEGFLRHSGLILLHDEALFQVIDQWLNSLNEKTFVSLLPLLRRTFATFTAPERRRIGELARLSGKPTPQPQDTPPEQLATLNTEYAERVLPTLATLIGLE